MKYDTDYVDEDRFDRKKRSKHGPQQKRQEKNLRKFIQNEIDDDDEPMKYSTRREYK